MNKTWCVCLSVVLLVAALAMAGCSPEKGEAKARVETVLKGLTMDENSNEYFEGLCQWYAGKSSIRPDDLEVAQDHLIKWLGAKSLKHPIKDYAVKGVVLRDGPNGKEAIVTVMVNGQERGIKVVAGETLEWSE